MGRGIFAETTGTYIGDIVNLAKKGIEELITL